MHEAASGSTQTARIGGDLSASVNLDAPARAEAANDPVMTMSSREIAELTAKEHKNVLADIRVMLEQLELTSADFSANLPDGYGRLQPGFALPKDLTITLVAGYSAPLRHRIVKRWLELEAAVAAPPRALTPAEMFLQNAQAMTALKASKPTVGKKATQRGAPCRSNRPQFSQAHPQTRAWQRHLRPRALRGAVGRRPAGHS